MGIQPWFLRHQIHRPAIAASFSGGCLVFYRNGAEDSRQQSLLVNLGTAIQRALGLKAEAGEPRLLAASELEAGHEDCRLALFCGVQPAELAVEEDLFGPSTVQVRTEDLTDLLQQPQTKAALWLELEQAIRGMETLAGDHR